MNNIIDTEKVNPNTSDIDLASSIDIVRMINNEDLKVAQKILEKLENIAKAIDLISCNFLKGGRLLYFGAGTSGRLGVLDASECPPTFNAPFEMVQGIIAGGDKALRYAIEGAEDSKELAKEDFAKLNITNKDTVTVLSASGNADYPVEILNLAKEKNAASIAISCNPNSKISQIADISICIETGAEVITGSTRMKAGTAEKMVLNMLSTGAMIKIGKVYKNLMVDLKPTNIKLKKRAVRIAASIACCDEKQAQAILESNGYKLKESILQIKYSIDFDKAQNLLEKNNGILRKVFKNFQSN